MISFGTGSRFRAVVVTPAAGEGTTGVSSGCSSPSPSASQPLCRTILPICRLGASPTPAVSLLPISELGPSLSELWSPSSRPVPHQAPADGRAVADDDMPLAVANSTLPNGSSCSLGLRITLLTSGAPWCREGVVNGDS